MIQQSCVKAFDQTSLAVSHWGDRPPRIVMIHGFADGRHVWTPFAQALSTLAGVISLDLRGHGDSERDPQGVYPIERFVSDVQVVIDQVGAERLLLVGHSLGAEIAIRWAAAHPGRVEGLALVDGGPGLVRDGMLQMRGHFSDRPRDFASREAYRQQLEAWMPLAEEGMLALAAEHAIGPVDEVFRLKSDPRLAQMALPDRDGALWQLLESLRCPRLLIRGEASAMLPRRAAEEMVRRCRGLSYETVAAAGHAVMMDNPVDFAAILRRFVTRLLATDAAPARAAALS